MTYHQLTEHERYMISRLRKTGHGVARIAQLLGRHRSTVYRECSRNATQVRGRAVYCPSKAPTAAPTSAWVTPSSFMRLRALSFQPFSSVLVMRPNA